MNRGIPQKTILRQAQYCSICSVALDFCKVSKTPLPIR